jgi:hypothetical protein
MNTFILHCELVNDEVIVTFADGYTYAFTSDFLFSYRLKHGQFLSASKPKTNP